MLWCTTKATESSKDAAENRKLGNSGGLIVLPDYRKEKYTCNKAEIEMELALLIETSEIGHFGFKLLYIQRDPEETSRSRHELRCRIVMVGNDGSKIKGIFRYHNQDDQALVNWQPGRAK